MALIRNPFFAWYFSRFGGRLEQRGNRELRREMLAGLSGRVLEVGAGSGLNFPHYPGSVTEVIAVEPEPYLRERATAAAAELPAADGEFGAVVVSCLLCSVTDVPAALKEFRRVLSDGGELRFYEHVLSRDPLYAAGQRAADLIWPRLMGGCHVQRQTRDAIGEVFEISTCRGFRFPPSALFVPAAPRILGVARKTAVRRD